MAIIGVYLISAVMEIFSFQNKGKKQNISKHVNAVTVNTISVFALPCSSSIYGQDPNPSAFDWIGVANQSQRFSHRSLKRKVSGLTQAQQARQHTLLKKTSGDVELV